MSLVLDELSSAGNSPNNRLLSISKRTTARLSSQVPTELTIDENCSQLARLLMKQDKNDNDAQLIFDEIKKFPVYEKYFKNTLKGMDSSNVLELMKGFTYERFNMGKFIFKEGDKSNNKFYIIISGKVGIIIPQKKAGNFGKYTVKHTKKLGQALSHQFSNVSAAPTLMGTADAMGNPAIKINFTNKVAGAGSITSIDDVGGGGSTTPNAMFKSPQATLTNIEFPSADRVAGGGGGGGGTTTNTHLQSPGNAGGQIDFTAAAMRASQNNSQGMSILNLEKSQGSGGNTTPLMSPINKSTEITWNEFKNQQILAVKEQDEENENDDQFGENEEENQQFEDFCKRFGKLIRYMKEGEGFGEVALTSHKPRTASVIARNRVEVLVLGKKHYDEVFLGVEREREEFIKKSFPMFDAIGSSQNIRLLLYSFKAKTFNKGDIVVHQGPIEEKDACIYIIQQGECSIEKKFQLNLENPYETRKTILSKKEDVIITQAGIGVMIGDELIANQNASDYEYTARVHSESCVCQFIARKDFMKFPTDFHEFIRKMYLQKKKQRDSTADKINFELTQKLNRMRQTNTFCLQNVHMVGLISKSARVGMNNHTKREQDRSPFRNEGGGQLPKEDDLVRSFSPAKGSIAVAASKDSSILMPNVPSVSRPSTTATVSRGQQQRNTSGLSQINEEQQVEQARSGSPSRKYGLLTGRIIFAEKEKAMARQKLKAQQQQQQKSSTVGSGGTAVVVQPQTQERLHSLQPSTKMTSGGGDFQQKLNPSQLNPTGTYPSSPKFQMQQTNLPFQRSQSPAIQKKKTWLDPTQGSQPQNFDSHPSYQGTGTKVFESAPTERIHQQSPSRQDAASNAPKSPPKKGTKGFNNQTSIVLDLDQPKAQPSHTWGAMTHKTFDYNQNHIRRGSMTGINEKQEGSVASLTKFERHSAVNSKHAEMKQSSFKANPSIRGVAEAEKTENKNKKKVVTNTGNSHKLKIIRSSNVSYEQLPGDKIQNKIEFIENFKYEDKIPNDPLKKLKYNKFFSDNETDAHIQRMVKVRAYRSGALKDSDMISYKKRDIEPVDMILAKFLEIKQNQGDEDDLNFERDRESIQNLMQLAGLSEEQMKAYEQQIEKRSMEASLRQQQKEYVKNMHMRRGSHGSQHQQQSSMSPKPRFSNQKIQDSQVTFAGSNDGGAGQNTAEVDPAMLSQSAIQGAAVPPQGNSKSGHGAFFGSSVGGSMMTMSQDLGSSQQLNMYVNQSQEGGINSSAGGGAPHILTADGKQENTTPIPVGPEQLNQKAEYATQEDVRASFTQMSSEILRRGLAILRANSPGINYRYEQEFGNNNVNNSGGQNRPGSSTTRNKMSKSQVDMSMSPGGGNSNKNIHMRSLKSMRNRVSSPVSYSHNATRGMVTPSVIAHKPDSAVGSKRQAQPNTHGPSIVMKSINLSQQSADQENSSKNHNNKSVRFLGNSNHNNSVGVIGRPPSQGEQMPSPIISMTQRPQTQQSTGRASTTSNTKAYNLHISPRINNQVDNSHLTSLTSADRRLQGGINSARSDFQTRPLKKPLKGSGGSFRGIVVGIQPKVENTKWAQQRAKTERKLTSSIGLQTSQGFFKTTVK